MGAVHTMSLFDLLIDQKLDYFDLESNFVMNKGVSKRDICFI